MYTPGWNDGGYRDAVSRLAPFKKRRVAAPENSMRSFGWRGRVGHRSQKKGRSLILFG